MGTICPGSKLILCDAFERGLRLRRTLETTRVSTEQLNFKGGPRHCANFEQGYRGGRLAAAEIFAWLLHFRFGAPASEERCRGWSSGSNLRLGPSLPCETPPAACWTRALMPFLGRLPKSTQYTRPQIHCRI